MTNFVAMFYSMKLYSFLILSLISLTLISQNQSKRVLFIGNSYTYVNNLPQLLANVANSTNDTIIFDNSTPGGYTLQGHSTNATSLAKIALGNWDYVVLQDQSQRPSFPDSLVKALVFPFAKKLDSLITAVNSCTETVFYMTWGRKNGDSQNCQFFAPLCTYQGMDSMLNLRYRHMADTNRAIVSPVGAVWNKIRSTYPLIDLYSADESHPSLKGTYAAACAFYASILRKDPTLITFNAGLTATAANQIKAVAKLIVYDSLLKWNIGRYDASANYTFQTNQKQVQFRSSDSLNSMHFWDFGDSTTSTLSNPIKTYNLIRNYTVKHFVSKCSQVDSSIQLVSIQTTSVENIANNHKIWFEVYPNPTSNKIVITNSNNSGFDYNLFGIKGDLLKSGKVTPEKNSLNLEGFDNGTYILQLLDKGKVIDSRSIIKH